MIMIGNGVFVCCACKQIKPAFCHGHLRYVLSKLDPEEAASRKQEEATTRQLVQRAFSVSSEPRGSCGCPNHAGVSVTRWLQSRQTLDPRSPTRPAASLSGKDHITVQQVSTPWRRDLTIIERCTNIHRKLPSAHRHSVMPACE